MHIIFLQLYSMICLLTSYFFLEMPVFEFVWPIRSNFEAIWIFQAWLKRIPKSIRDLMLRAYRLRPYAFYSDQVTGDQSQCGQVSDLKPKVTRESEIYKQTYQNSSVFCRLKMLYIAELTENTQYHRYTYSGIRELSLYQVASFWRDFLDIYSEILIIVQYFTTIRSTPQLYMSYMLTRHRPQVSLYLLHHGNETKTFLILFRLFG